MRKQNEYIRNKTIEWRYYVCFSNFGSDSHQSSLGVINVTEIGIHIGSDNTIIKIRSEHYVCIVQTASVEIY